MKKVLLFLVLLSFSFVGFAQNIQFADNGFKSALFFGLSRSDTDGDGIADSVVDLNGDGEISTSEASMIIEIYLASFTQPISSLQDLNFFANVKKLELQSLNGIPVLPLGSLSLLEILSVRNSDFNTYDLSNNLLLRELSVPSNNLTRPNIIFGLNSSIESLQLTNVIINELNFDNFQNLYRISLNNVSFSNGNVSIKNNPLLEEVLMTSTTGTNNLIIENNPLLKRVALIDSILTSIELINGNGSQVNRGFDDVTVSIQGISNLTSVDFSNNLIDEMYLGGYIGSSLNLSSYSINVLHLLGLNLTELHLPIVNQSQQNPFLPSLILNDLLSWPTIFQQPNSNPNISIDGSNNINTINLSNLILSSLSIVNHLSLEQLFLGRFNNMPNQTTFRLIRNNPALNYVCSPWLNEVIVDNIVNNPTANNGTAHGNSITVNSYCSLTLDNLFSEIDGQISMDIDNNGCSSSDPALSFFNFSATNGITTGTISSDQTGVFYAPVGDGQHTITPNPENPSYWNFSPPSVTVNFPTQTSPQTQDFCVTANGTVQDLEVVIVPLELARPGFVTDYKVIVKNKGNVTTSGTVSLDFEENFMTLASTNPTAGNSPSNRINWSFGNLQPFQMEEFLFSMTLNTPTQATNPLNGGDRLLFTGNVSVSTGTDAMPTDNTMTLDQLVVNSFDPNDKTCLEGETIEPSQVGDYVHYLIRFENTGTASAVNVVVKDVIDTSKFDITTLVPLGGSDNYYTRILEGNVVEFIHEDINLDFNDATNDGYVLFKIKTLSTLVSGDTFDNEAQIYFDFNAPITTNNESVLVQSTASIAETTDSSIRLFPNPAGSSLNIHAVSSINKLNILDASGRVISTAVFTGNSNEHQVDISNLSSGIYFATIQSNTGSSTIKFIKE